MRATKLNRHDDVPQEAGKTGDECVVERIVGHRDDYEETKYLVQQYGHSPAEDTWEPFHHIAQHFIC